MKSQPFPGEMPFLLFSVIKKANKHRIPFKGMSGLQIFGKITSKNRLVWVFSFQNECPGVFYEQ